MNDSYDEFVCRIMISLFTLLWRAYLGLGQGFNVSDKLNVIYSLKKYDQ